MKFLWTGMIAAVSLCCADVSWDSCKQETLAHRHEVTGWCSREKAEKMMDLIYRAHPEVCVEIGVFAGASIYPTARALQFIDRGIVHAIDPWTNEDCQEGFDPNDANYLWWSSINLEKIYEDFLAMLEHYNINAFCHPMKMTSKEALAFFLDESIDVLHVDGNHAPEVALADVRMWFPKVKKGGYIWFDDANWHQTKKAVSYLKERCILHAQSSVGNECLLFQKP